MEIRLDSKVWRVNYRSDVWRGEEGTDCLRDEISLQAVMEGINVEVGQINRSLTKKH